MPCTAPIAPVVWSWKWDEQEQKQPKTCYQHFPDFPDCPLCWLSSPHSSTLALRQAADAIAWLVATCLVHVKTLCCFQYFSEARIRTSNDVLRNARLLSTLLLYLSLFGLRATLICILGANLWQAFIETGKAQSKTWTHVSGLGDSIICRGSGYSLCMTAQFETWREHDREQKTVCFCFSTLERMNTPHPMECRWLWNDSIIDWTCGPAASLCLARRSRMYWACRALSASVLGFLIDVTWHMVDTRMKARGVLLYDFACNWHAGTHAGGATQLAELWGTQTDSHKETNARIPYYA